MAAAARLCSARQRSQGIGYAIAGEGLLGGLGLVAPAFAVVALWMALMEASRVVWEWLGWG